MAVKKVGKLKKEATRYLSKRQYEKAGEVFEELFLCEPENPRWPQKAGEAYRQTGDTARAVRAFQSAAEVHARQGFLLKAIALCKLILDIDSGHKGTQEMLTELYADQSREAALASSAFITHAPSQPETSVPAVQERSLGEISLSTAVPDARPQAGKAGEDTVFEILIDEEDLEEVLRAGRTASKGPGDLISQLPTVPLFSSLDKTALQALIEKVDLRVFAPGDPIIRQGDRDKSLFVLVEGEVAVFREGETRVELSRLGEGAFFGEIALIADGERSATVEAVSQCALLEISRQVVNDLISVRPDVLKVILRFFRDRLVDTLIETHPLFAPFGGEDRLGLARRFTLIEAPPGCTLLQEGVKASGLFVMLVGKAGLTGKGAKAAHLETGDIFGEASLLGAEPSAFTVRTETKCWLLKMDTAIFQEVIMTHPHVLAHLSELTGGDG